MAYYVRVLLVLAGLAVYGWSLTEPGAVITDLSVDHSAPGDPRVLDGSTSIINGLEVATTGWLPLLLLNPAGLAWVGILLYLSALALFLLRLDWVALWTSLCALVLPVAGGLLTRVFPFMVDASGTNYAQLDHFLPFFWVSLLGPVSVVAGAAGGLRFPAPSIGPGRVIERPMGRKRYILPYLGAYSSIPVVLALGWGPSPQGSSTFLLLITLVIVASTLAGVVSLFFIFQIWARIPPRYRPYFPGTVTAVMGLPLIHLAWQFVALPGWVTHWERYRADQGRETGPRIRPLANWTCGLWLTSLVPFAAALAAPAAIVCQAAFIGAAAREVNRVYAGP